MSPHHDRHRAMVNHPRRRARSFGSNRLNTTRMDYLEGVLLGFEWRIEPEALRRYVADRRTPASRLEAVSDTESL